MLPNSGSRLPGGSYWPSEAEYVARISEALRAELGATRVSAKTIMRWTGTSDRTARNWIRGYGGPSGCHLLCLARQSDAVLTTVLEMAGRPELRLASDIEAVEVALLKAIGAVENLKRKPLRGRQILP